MTPPTEPRTALGEALSHTESAHPARPGTLTFSTKMPPMIVSIVSDTRFSCAASSSTSNSAKFTFIGQFKADTSKDLVSATL